MTEEEEIDEMNLDRRDMPVRDHRTDEPATRCTEPVGWTLAARECGNLMPCDHSANPVWLDIHADCKAALDALQRERDEYATVLRMFTDRSVYGVDVAGPAYRVLAKWSRKDGR